MKLQDERNMLGESPVGTGRASSSEHPM